MIGCKIYCSIDQYIIPLTGWKAFNDKNAIYVIEHYKIVYYLHNLLTIIKRNECLWLLKGSHCWRLSSWNMNFDAEIHAFFFYYRVYAVGKLGQSLSFLCVYTFDLYTSVCGIWRDNCIHFQTQYYNIFIFTAGKFQEKVIKKKCMST